jgi:hypothetical protein
MQARRRTEFPVQLCAPEACWHSCSWQCLQARYKIKGRQMTGFSVAAGYNNGQTIIINNNNNNNNGCGNGEYPAASLPDYCVAALKACCLPAFQRKHTFPFYFTALCCCANILKCSEFAVLLKHCEHLQND